MYENMTYEVLLQRMLDRVPDTVDKREGAIVYDALAPSAMELAQMYIEADVILNETFADTASRENLIKRAAERGLSPESASSAILKGVFNINVPIGSRLSLGNLNYSVTEKVQDYQYKLQCETPGAEGNLHLGTLIPIDYIDDLTSAQLTALLIPGEDEEETEVFRTRYINSLDSQAFGGNNADYKEKVNAIQGVGGVKVYPVWNGGGTVKLVIIDSQYKKPTMDLITMIQTVVDPVSNSGQGKGIAPIGHVVTVTALSEQIINIITLITYQAGYTWDDLKSSLQATIDAYYLELSQTWESSTSLVVRISQLESRLLNVSGVLDVASTTLNGSAANLILDQDSIPKRGTINGVS